MAVNELKRFSFVVDFIEPDPQVDTPDMRARVLGEHDKAIRAAAARITALLTSDTLVATLLKAHGIEFRTGLSH
jgi:Arc/MetJ family transcription regulator